MEGHDASPGSRPLQPVPHDFDAPEHQRLTLLGSNRCIASPDVDALPGNVVEAACDGLSATGRGRFHIDAAPAGAQIWSDLSWRCWSAEGDGIVERPCADVAAQRFHVDPAGGGAGSEDIRVVASDGRCVGSAFGAVAGQALELGACGDSPLQIIRL